MLFLYFKKITTENDSKKISAGCFLVVNKIPGKIAQGFSLNQKSIAADTNLVAAKIIANFCRCSFIVNGKK